MSCKLELESTPRVRTLFDELSGDEFLEQFADRRVVIGIERRQPVGDRKPRRAVLERRTARRLANICPRSVLAIPAFPYSTCRGSGSDLRLWRTRNRRRFELDQTRINSGGIARSSPHRARVALGGIGTRAARRAPSVNVATLETPRVATEQDALRRRAALHEVTELLLGVARVSGGILQGQPLGMHNRAGA